MMATIKLLILLSLAALSTAQGPNPVVRVANGILQGSWKVSTKGRPFASFQGIPYARPPIGKYRFREPQPMKHWSGVWDASRPLSGCLQYEPFEGKILGSENCLFVNVFTPNLNPTASLPVLVFIHGGAFMYGEGGIYDPANIMDWNMVVVTLNYRLGPLGFLSTGDEVAPGNNGLKDQSFALHWVKNNIMMFGGNPDSVTLTGCSAGGASVHYHYLSPLSRGTFARGIAFSGSAFASWTHAVNPAEKAKTLASIVGCPTGSSKEMMECLKYRPAEVVVNAQIEMLLFNFTSKGLQRIGDALVFHMSMAGAYQQPYLPYQLYGALNDWKVHLFTPFTPTTEPAGVREPFLNQYPYKAAKSGAMQNLPLITTVTSEEGLYPAAVYQTQPNLLRELEARWDQLASNIFEYNDTLPLNMRSSVAAKIKQHYLESKPVGDGTFPQLVQALSDRLFVADVGRLAQVHSLKSDQPVYVYRYAYRAKTSLSEVMGKNNKNNGVCHADDVLLIFKYPQMDAKSGDDMLMKDALIEMIYSYSTTGVPKLLNTEWIPVKAGSAEINYLDISSPTKALMKSSSDFGQKSFWDSLGFDENENHKTYVRTEL